MKYFKFLIGKARCYSITTIVRLELESLVNGMLSLVPTLFGIFLRGVASKLFFQNLNGFPWIQPRCTIIHSDRIKAGTNLAINSGTYINGVGGIEFGNFVLIGSNVTISSGEHPIAGIETPIFSRISIPRKIVIKDDVWIGAGVVIMPGITVAKGTVIGANAVVTKDTEEYSICVGVPARKIGDRRNKLEILDQENVAD
jgi:maltose O-acetyltransferase